MSVAKSVFRMGNVLPKLAVSVTAGILLLSPVQSWACTDDSNQYYEDALAWLKKNDIRAAIIQLRNSLQQCADNHSARLMLGRLYLQNGNLQGAAKELDYVHRRAPSDETEVTLGQAQIGLRQYRQALTTVREVADDPKFGGAKTLIRAEALFALNVLDEAETKAADLLKADATSTPANLLMAKIKARQGNRQASERHIDTVLLANPNLVEAYILRAQLALHARDFDQVLAVADKVIEVAPTDPRGKLMKAEALVRKNALEEARQVLAAFLEESPGVISAIYLQSRVLMLLNGYEAADAELAKLPDAVRRQPAASLIVGLVKYQLEQFAQAEEALDRFVSVAGDAGRQARRLLANIQLRSDRPLAALQTLEPLIGGTSSDVASFQLAASAALRTGDLTMVRTSLQRVAQVGSAGDRQQAMTFLQVLRGAKKNEAAKLTLDPVALGVLQALDLAQFGDSDAALAKAETLQKEQPDNAAVANLLSRLYVSDGELEKARAALAPVLVREPTHLTSITNMNRIDVGEGKFEAVEARLRKALSLDPANEPLILQLANYLANRSSRDAALALLQEKAVEIPGSLAIRANLINISLRQKKTEEARRWADEAYQIGLTTNQNGLTVAAEAYAALKDYKATVDAYSTLAEKQDQAPTVLLKLTQAQLLNGDQPAAKTTIEKVLAANPANFAANRALIAMLLGAKDEAGAMAVADAAGEVNAPLGSVLRASVYRRMGNIDQAIVEMQNQLAITPSSGLVQRTYDLLLEAERRDDAAGVVSGWLGENPDDANMLQLLSSHYIQDKKLRRARVLLERAYSMLPNNVVVLNNLSWLRYELKEGGAIALARRAYKIAPNSAAVADTLGWILVREGEFEEGLKLLYAAADGAPKNGDIAYHVAFALNETGKTQESVQGLERILAEEVEEQNFTERDKAEALLAKLKNG